jgi:hypothetical protein
LGLKEKEMKDIYDENVEQEATFTIDINTPDSRSRIIRPMSDGTWCELLGAFYGLLQALGYSFTDEVDEVFQSLIDGSSLED